MGFIVEEWRDVIGFEGLYKVSNFGQVQTVKTGEMKKQTIADGDKRPYLSLWKNNKIKVCRPHKLVMEAFVGVRPQGMECCHNDGNPQNNYLSNLRWDTPKNNHADKVKHGTTNRGERCAAAKLTLEQVNQIRQDNRLQRIIATEYGVQQSQISRIKNGNRWQHDV
jgi:hypothetical protein